MPSRKILSTANHAVQPPAPPQAPGTAFDIALTFLTICLTVYLLHVGAPILIPFVIALFVWYLVNAIARGIGRMSWQDRTVPRMFCFALALLLLLGGIWFAYKLISVNALDVIRQAPVYQRKFADFLPELLQSIPESYRPNSTDIVRYLNVGGFMTALVRMFTGVAGKALVVVFYTGFLLYEQKFFARKLTEMTRSRESEARVHHILRNIDANFQRYIAVKMFTSLMTGLSTWVLLLFFNVDFAEFWGVMAFVLNFIPYVGSIAAVAMPAVVALAQSGDLTMFFIVTGGLCVIQLFWSLAVDPHLMGDSLNLSPIFIIFSLTGWGMIWGIPGAFLSVLILAIIVVTCAQFPRTRPLAILLSKTGEVERMPAARLPAATRGLPK